MRHGRVCSGGVRIVRTGWTGNIGHGTVGSLTVGVVRAVRARIAVLIKRDVVRHVGLRYLLVGQQRMSRSKL